MFIMVQSILTALNFSVDFTDPLINDSLVLDMHLQREKLERLKNLLLFIEFILDYYLLS